MKIHCTLPKAVFPLEKHMTNTMNIIKGDSNSTQRLRCPITFVLLVARDPYLARNGVPGEKFLRNKFQTPISITAEMPHGQMGGSAAPMGICLAKAPYRTTQSLRRIRITLYTPSVAQFMR